ncbi:MAG: hypothetical protein ACW99U_06715 [Candidatus Thorarchaeota archaeon]
MTDRDSIVYEKLVRVCRRHIQWIGLSEAARDILAVLLVENYWSGDPLSPEALSSITGYSRGSISVAVSQLRTLGFIETRMGPKQKGRGRPPTYYALTEGLSGLVMFGVRRLSVEIEGILTGVDAIKMALDVDEIEARRALVTLEQEATSITTKLREYTRKMLTRRVPSETDLTERVR